MVTAIIMNIKKCFKNAIPKLITKGVALLTTVFPFIGIVFTLMNRKGCDIDFFFILYLIWMCCGSCYMCDEFIELEEDEEEEDPDNMKVYPIPPGLT